MPSAKRYLLILGCSDRKRKDPGLLPAIERYDGVNYRVLQKAKREGFLLDDLDIVIISAKFGLLSCSTPIPDYDLAMTRSQSLAMQSSVSSALDRYLTNTYYDEIFINLGKIYLLALGESLKLSNMGTNLIYATGGIGQKMQQMKLWLHAVTSSVHVTPF